MRILSTIKAALPYLHVPEVKRELERTLDTLDKTLEDVGLQTDDAMDQAVKELEGTMNAHDEEISTRRTKLRQAEVAGSEEEEDA